MIIFLYLLIAVLIIIILTSKFKINPAISLIIGSVFLGLILKMNLLKIIILISEGIWSSIKGIGLIILFSCIIGQILKESNSIKNFGNLILINLKNKSLLSLNILGLFIGTVVFCDSAFLILNGISKEDSKKITNLVKSSKAKVQASINGDEVRITGKKRDDLQSMIELLKSSDIKIPLQFQNFRD